MSHTNVPEPVWNRSGCGVASIRGVRGAVDGLDPPAVAPGDQRALLLDEAGLDVEHVGEVGSEIDSQRPSLRRR